MKENLTLSQKMIISLWNRAAVHGARLAQAGPLRPSDLNNNYWREAIFIYLLQYINKINFSYQKRFKKYLSFTVLHKKKSAMSHS